jgi:Exonuclease V - a 5' deoxyribonuclease
MPIIGTKTFAYDDAFLNEHVARTLEWWYGYRDPRGVSLKDSRRCLSVPLMILVGTFCLPHGQYLVRVNTSQAVSGGSRRQ